MSWMYRLIQRSTDEATFTLDASVDHIVWGTAAAPVTLTTANDIGFSRYITASATSGTTYGEYLKVTGSGAGAEVIANRSWVKASAALANAHGMHASLSVTSTGYVTGLGTAVRGNITWGSDTVVPQGTYYGVYAEIYPAGNTGSLPANSNACLGINAQPGTASDLTVNAFAFNGTSASGAMIATASSDITSFTGSIRVLVNGAVRYIPLVTSRPS